MDIIAAWHGCLEHNRNHCGECRTCDCLSEDSPGELKEDEIDFTPYEDDILLATYQILGLSIESVPSEDPRRDEWAQQREEISAELARRTDR